ncbi:kinase/pyrophosphorylase [Cohnella thermotolerans]|uniref:kinase/pyrophosphorylase n=1 Tax=Cohnella thermotolerans TaxID=329858 RepID=UPI000406DD86
MDIQRNTIFVCSDSVGETAEAVVRATARQFDAEQVNIRRWAHIKSEEEIRLLMEEAARSGWNVPGRRGHRRQ